MRWYNPLENLASMPTRSLGVPLFEGGRKPLTRNQGIPIGQIDVVFYRSTYVIRRLQTGKKVAFACPVMPSKSFLTASVGDLMVEPQPDIYEALQGVGCRVSPAKRLQTDESKFFSCSAEPPALGQGRWGP